MQPYTEGEVFFLPSGRAARLVKLSYIDAIIAGLAHNLIKQWVKKTKPFDPYKKLDETDGDEYLEALRTVTMAAQVEPPIVEGNEPGPGQVGSNTLDIEDMRFIAWYALDGSLPEVADAPFRTEAANLEAGSPSTVVPDGSRVRQSAE